jgi:predicted phosphodiesterase
MKRIVWYSDTHLNLAVLPFLKRRFINSLKGANADGIVISGDVSSGSWLESDLRYLATHFQNPIYFVLGNHDYHKRHIDSVHSDVRRLAKQFPNLYWLTDHDCLTLNNDVAIIGTEGWYDASLGDPQLLKYTTDWWLTFDFFHLQSHNDRLEKWRQMAKHSAELLAHRLENALENYKTVYVVTHFPPWKEATRAVGTLMQRFWLPYNTNVVLGEMIERVMRGKKKKRVIVLSGHTHTPCHIRVSNTIECMVARASYFGRVRPEQTLIV